MTNEQTFSVDTEPLNVTPFPSFILLPTGTIAKGTFMTFDYSTVEQEELKKQPIRETLFASISDDIIESILTSTRPLCLHDIVITVKEQTTITVTLYTKPITYENHNAVYVLCVPTEDLRSLDEEQQHLMDLKNGIHQSFMTVTLDQDGFITQTNQPFLKTSNWTPKRVIGKTFWQLFPKTEASEKEAQDIWKTLKSGKIWQGEVQKLTKDEQVYWVQLTAIPLFGQTTETNHYLLVEHDITKDKTIQFQLEKIAYIDPETGMINLHRLEQVITTMIEEQRHFSFVYLSIDKFYTIKDIHDELAGNSLIIEFTKRMKMYFQDSTMARINENEFVVITPLPEWFTQGFLNYLQQNPIYNGNVAVPLSISGGITRYPEDQSTFSQLMKASLATITSVREAGGDSILSLSKSSHAALNRKSIVETRLLQALDQKNLHVLYQPQLDIKTGKITSVEALVRWEDEIIGVVSPDELIPIAEETGLINNIGSFMLEKACEQAVIWKEAGHGIKVSINSSVREFRDKNMANSILETLGKTGCPANLLQIEITEKFALEAESETGIIKQMRTLENEGISFALDDFGTGYGSFRYIHLLPISSLKIDKTFTSALLKSEKSQQLMNGMVQLGKSMNLTVIAEGVETEQQQELLIDYGCDALQGYYISKPISNDEVTKLF
ncbi:diguanylate cyclase [Lysinibacillus sp. 2017]|uniref:sensor domain-containing protein n=1 Tax=unclassified Lysinibacillus TaxID=2636778 RepID=UPI000D52840F|nr:MULTISPECIES: GGDEF domain-containing phosphodiesterase [unclassified Lysinibacillus]AWE06150.1 diguanylate cyclase [Lysinibacillus sp. 2017]TGN35195.1 phosphodiesterase [Lysinibacillus sp. S2017]